MTKIHVNIENAPKLFINVLKKLLVEKNSSKHLKELLIFSTKFFLLQKYASMKLLKISLKQINGT